MLKWRSELLQALKTPQHRVREFCNPHFLHKMSKLIGIFFKKKSTKLAKSWSVGLADSRGVSESVVEEQEGHGLMDVIAGGARRGALCTAVIKDDRSPCQLHQTLVPQVPTETNCPFLSARSSVDSSHLTLEQNSQLLLRGTSQSRAQPFCLNQRPEINTSFHYFQTGQ